MNQKRPCKCRCFDYYHIPNAYKASTDKEYITRGECLTCDDCMNYEPMDNLTYLEYEATRQSL